MAPSIPWLAAAVPLLLYVATASGAGYWLDSGELVAATAWLDIAHPPGHPLSLLYGKLFALLPLGSLPFRLALGQAVAGALACAFIAIAARQLARAAGLEDARESAPLELIAAWLPALGYAMWFQAVRPEVYALQTAVLCAAVAALCTLERRAAQGAGQAGSLRLVAVASLCLGLGLANHHLTAVLCLPALAYCVLRVWRRHGATVLGVSGLFGALALLCYAYLPVRASAGLARNLGDPRTFENFLWVVSAKVYAHHTGSDNPQPLVERYADGLVVLIEHFHGVFLLTAVWGLYVLFRRRSTQGLGTLLSLIVLSVVGGRLWIGPVRGNPDSLGYLGVGFAALGLLNAAFFSALRTMLSTLFSRRALSLGLWGTTALAFGLQLSASYARCDLASFSAMELFDDQRHAALPPRSVVVATMPQTVFRYWEGEVSEGMRPDVAVVPVPFLRYPGVAKALISRHNELAGVVTSYRAKGRLDRGALVRLARSRSVMLELDVQVPAAWYPGLAPAGMLYVVASRDQVQATLPVAQRLQARIYASLYRRLGPWAAELETSRQLLWVHFMDALYYAAQGRIEASRKALGFARALHSRDAHLQVLAARLRGAREGTPIDVAPLLEFE